MDKSEIAEEVYRFAYSLATENSVDVGQVLLQAVGLCMNTNEKTQNSDNDPGTDPPTASTSSNKYGSTEEILSSDNPTSSSPDTDSIGTKAKSLSHNEHVVEISNKGKNEAVAVLVKPANTKSTMEDIPEVIKLDDEDDEDDEDLVLDDEDDENLVLDDEDLTKKEHARTEDYFDMDCEEIDETVEEEKGNDISGNMKKDTSNDHEVFIIDDDEEENCLHEKDSIEKSSKMSDENETEINDKEAQESTSKNICSTNIHSNSIDIINLDSESEEESDKSVLNDVHKVVSHTTTSTVSIVGIFTNKSQLQSTNIDSLSGDKKSEILETNPSSVTLFGDLAESDFNSKFRDEVDSLIALGLVPINGAPVSSQSQVDRYAHKRLFTKMASDIDGLEFQQEPNREEGSTSPRIKKRLLDFDKKWHMGPKYSPEQDKYLARPGGIDANVYIKELETRVMPSVSHMNGTEFRNPGLYTSVSTCAPNVVIESVDSNQPVDYNWHNCCNSHIDQNHHHQESEEDDESVESDSSSSVNSYRSYKRSRLNKSTKGSRTSSVSSLQKARKKLIHSLDESHDFISERSRGRGKTRKISNKHERGNKLLYSSVGRGSTRGRKNVTILTIGGGRGRGTGSLRGRGRIATINPRAHPRGRGAGLSQNVPSKSPGSDSKSVVRGRGSYRGKRGRGSSVRGSGNKKSSGSGVYVASLLNSAKKKLNRKDNHKQSLVETKSKKHNDSITKRGRGKKTLSNRIVFPTIKVSDNVTTMRKKGTVTVHKSVNNDKQAAKVTGKTLKEADQPELLTNKPKRGRPRKIQVLDKDLKSTT